MKEKNVPIEKPQLPNSQTPTYLLNAHEKEFTVLWGMTLDSMKKRPILMDHFNLNDPQIVDTFRTIADIFFNTGLEIGSRDGYLKGMAQKALIERLPVDYSAGGELL